MTNPFTHNDASSTQSLPGRRGYQVSKHSRALELCRIELQSIAVNCSSKPRDLAARGEEARPGVIDAGRRARVVNRGRSSRDCGPMLKKGVVRIEGDGGGGGGGGGANFRRQRRLVVFVGNSCRESQSNSQPADTRGFSDPGGGYSRNAFNQFDQSQPGAKTSACTHQRPQSEAAAEGMIK
ncbi:hypothetical protein OIDMADRAFT_54194 [Oidiodendron maius Zn]|uniref:Uncharacterized protein n=1 Tax=Oidiodendron maius (strain Zn) TaxID=913774 RepID=A0A0C3DGF2_OIDMZ|nr:hypothetical protein OIDMADRAFT_54194 [Oidiodendron maius Zn]